MSKQTPTIRVSLYEGGTLVREEVFTQKTIRIGRGGQNHLRLQGEGISNLHCMIEWKDSGEFLLSDLESATGTFVNGKKVSHATLNPGDEVKVGETTLVFDFEAGRTAAIADGSWTGSLTTATGPLGLEVAMLWGDRTLYTDLLRPGETLTVGTDPKARVFLPEEVVGGTNVALARPDGEDFLLDVSLPGAEGDFLVEGRIVRLPEMRRRELVEQGRYVRINRKTRARLQIGSFVFVMGLSPLPAKRPVGSWTRRFSLREHLYLLVSLVLHLAFMVLVTLVPEEQLRAVRDPYERRTEALKRIQVAMLERKVEEEKKEREEERRKLEQAQQVQQPGTVLSQRPVDEKPTSRLVTEDQVQKDRQVADTALTRVLGDQQDLMNQVLDAVGPGIGGGMMGIRVIGDRGLDAELAMGLDAFGGTLGGGGGGGFRGTGWGGGSEFGPADLRGIQGLSRSEAEGAASRLKFRGGGEPVVYSGPSSVTGELDKETVRRYIQTKMDQVKWCYQQELQKNPSLQGDVNMEWLILADGSVAQVRVSGGSLGSPAVEQCLKTRIVTWQFPAPKSGGIARVVYPFIFRATTTR